MSLGQIYIIINLRIISNLFTKIGIEAKSPICNFCNIYIWIYFQILISIDNNIYINVDLTIGFRIKFGFE